MNSFERSFTLALFCLVLLATSLPAQQPGSNPGINIAEGPDFKVRAFDVIRKGAPNAKPLYEFNYDYNFGNRSDIYITGLGLAPARGHFHYMGSEPVLEFKASHFGSTLAYVPLTTTATRSDSPEIPDISQFTELARTGQWSGTAQFPTVAAAVIQKYFQLGYLPRQLGTVNYYVTSYRDLELPDGQLRGQIALAISQPYGSSGDRFEYHVQYRARDRARLSSSERYDRDANPATLTAAEKFLNQFMDDFAKATSKTSDK